MNVKAQSALVMAADKLRGDAARYGLVVGTQRRADGAAGLVMPPPSRPIAEVCPYYEMVPKGFDQNLAFRREMIRLGSSSKAAAHELWIMCSRDILFYVSAFCIAGGTLVVTDRGLVAIENVTAEDLVWDGQEWVGQGGSVCNGRRIVISEYGIRLTPEHKVMTTMGWREASSAITRAPVRLPPGCGTGASPQFSGDYAVVYDLINCGPRHAFTVLDDEGDPLLVSNCWTYDPRKDRKRGRVGKSVVADDSVDNVYAAPVAGTPALPFIPYGFQETSLVEIDAAIGSHDLLVEKSRDMGASWMMLIAFEWRWHFHDLQSFLMCSRKDELVDKTGDPKSLFWKIDFIHANLPGWLLPTLTRQKSHLHNEDNGSTIDGESTTGDMGRGDRRTAIMLDEFAAVEDGARALAATADATNCRLFNSTPAGTNNAFYEVAKSGIKKLRLHWTLHPLKAAGLNFVEGKPRSPWYDAECERRPHPMEVAQELDIDYLGSDYTFFDTAVLEKLVATDVRAPYLIGDLDFDAATVTPVSFVERQNGPMRLWIHMGADGKPPADREYAIGVDIAAGTGASNSSISIGDRRTGEKIGEYTNPRIKPSALAKLAVALCRFFQGCRSADPAYGAFLIWEANGPGREFGDTVVGTGYRHIYFRQNERTITKRQTDAPGWFSTVENKLALLGEYRRALGSGEFINRSAQAIRECGQYVFLASGTVEHSKSVKTEDPSGARENHGDVVISDALLWKGLKQAVSTAEEPATAERGSLLARREAAVSRLRRDRFW